MFWHQYYYGIKGTIMCYLKKDRLYKDKSMDVYLKEV